MKTFNSALFAAHVTAIRLQDAAHDTIFDPISPEKYMKADDFENFKDFAVEKMGTHGQQGTDETAVTDTAIQGLLDYYNNMAAADNSLIDFGNKMSEIGSELENDLRVWWDNSPDTNATTTSSTVVPAAPVVIGDMYGDSCTQPALVAAAGELTMEEKFFTFPSAGLKTFEQANAFCWEEGMYLASVHSQEENDYLQSQLQKLSAGTDFWIGFRDTEMEGNYYWSDNTCVDFERWADGEPNNMGDEDCTHLMGSGYWNDNQCTNTYAFACRDWRSLAVRAPDAQAVADEEARVKEEEARVQEEEEAREAERVRQERALVLDSGNGCVNDDTDWIYNALKNPNFIYNGDQPFGNNFQAEAKCVEAGGHLASIHSQAENDLVRSLNGEYKTWIGGEWDHSQWNWTDGTCGPNVPQYVNWDDNEPNGNLSGNETCILMRTNGKWNDISCLNTLPFFCRL